MPHLCSGGYSGSCNHCNIAHDSTLRLNCYCWDMQNHLAPSSIDLSEFVFFHAASDCFSTSNILEQHADIVFCLDQMIFDQDGAMGCFDVLGNKSRAP